MELDFSTPAKTLKTYRAGFAGVDCDMADVDKLLGELSFPLYISQVLIIMLAREFVYESEWVRIVFIICALLIFSFVLHTLSRPIEKYRANRL